MCCEHLVCARCAHPVADARCPACRAARARMHPRQSLLSPAMLMWLVVLLTLAAFLSNHLR